jgi:hypothetical protein
MDRSYKIQQFWEINAIINEFTDLHKERRDILYKKQQNLLFLIKEEVDVEQLDDTQLIEYDRLLDIQNLEQSYR